MASPRVLRLTFELHVPEGLRANVRTARIDTAIASFTSAVQSLAASVFPWADRMTVRSEWSYRWREDSGSINLPATNENTVDVPMSADEEAALIVGAAPE